MALEPLKYKGPLVQLNTMLKSLHLTLPKGKKGAIEELSLGDRINFSSRVETTCLASSQEKEQRLKEEIKAVTEIPVRDYGGFN